MVSTPLRITELQASAEYWCGKVLDGTISGLGIVGPGGLGKTYGIEKLLAKRGIDVEMLGKNSHITPLSLYQTLYQFRSEKLLLLDDIDHIYKNDVATGILRSALWGQQQASGKRKRVVTYSSSKDIGTPGSFVNKCGIVLIGNKIPRKDDPIVEALLSRIPCVEFSVTPSDVYAFMREVMCKRGYSLWNGKKKVTIPHKDCERVIAELEARGVLNLRVLEHALIAFLDFRRSPTRFARELDTIASRRLTPQPAAKAKPPKQAARDIFRELMANQTLTEEEKVAAFTKRTAGLRSGREDGYSRPTYFRWKKKFEDGSF